MIKFIAKHKSPQKGSKSAAGWDIFSSEEVILPAGETRVIPTGLSFEIPEGSYGKIESRSSWARGGYFTAGGIIDADYRGEVGIIMFNSTKKDLMIPQGTKCAQIIFMQFLREIIESTVLTQTDRGSGGFGSTDL